MRIRRSRENLPGTLAVIVVCAAVAILCVSPASAQPHRLGLIPSAKFGCTTCHYDPRGGGARNPFGEDWERAAMPAGDRMTAELKAKDSDGDTYTNAQEFSAGTNPGNPDSKPEQ